MSDYVPVTGESARVRHHGVKSSYSTNMVFLCNQGYALTQVQLDSYVSSRCTPPQIAEMALCKRCERKAAGQ